MIGSLGRLIPQHPHFPLFPLHPSPSLASLSLPISICRLRNANDPDWPVSLVGTERENVMAVNPASPAPNGAMSATMRHVLGNLEL